MTHHQQVWTKINAPVDKGIEPLIAALSGFAPLQTIESCEATADHSAWVCFHYGPEGEWRELAEFVFGFLGPGLAQAVGDRASVQIRINGCGTPQGGITIRPGMIPEVTAALVSLYRNSACYDGKSGTGP